MKTDPNWRGHMDEIYRAASREVSGRGAGEPEPERLSAWKAAVVVIGACALIWGGIWLVWW